MGNKPSRLVKQSIDLHNETTAKSRLKILLIGANSGKSQWFNARRDNEFISKIDSLVTFKIESFVIGDKLPDVKTVIYDTPRNMLYCKTNLGYIASADGLILTYDIHSMDSIYHLEECMKQIDSIVGKRTPCLLLGIQEMNAVDRSKNIVDAAQQFAVKWSLFHLEIDMTRNFDSNEPYLYLLRKILNQKQPIQAPFDEQKVSAFAIDEDDEESDNKVDLMPYTFRSFSNERSPKQRHQQKNKKRRVPPDQPPKKCVSLPVGGYFAHNQSRVVIVERGFNAAADDEKVNPLEQSHVNDVSVDDDAVCQLEFERFFQLSMGAARSGKYLDQFRAKLYNDIRLVDPDILDAAWFESGEIAMSVLDSKLFIKAIQKYKHDYVKFEAMLGELGMTEKYHKKFEKRGIGTYWSFYHHMRSVYDVDGIVGNYRDALRIWDKINPRDQPKVKSPIVQAVQQVEGQSRNDTRSHSMMSVPLIPMDMGMEMDSSCSDSDDDLYVDHAR